VESCASDTLIDIGHLRSFSTYVRMGLFDVKIRTSLHDI
jgi:hypothetical protein